MEFLDFLARNWGLAALLLGSLSLWLVLELRRSGTLLTPPQLVEKRNRSKALLYDMRGEAAHGAGHIAGAEPLAPGTDAAKLAEQLRGRKKADLDVILVCDTGSQSANLSKQLAAQGIAKATALKGGMRRWREDNLPLVAKATKAAKAAGSGKGKKGQGGKGGDGKRAH